MSDPLTHILVVDDEPPIARVLSSSLKTAGYRVTSARNGADALSGAHQGVIAYCCACQGEAFAQSEEMRLRESVDLEACCFSDGAHEGDGRALTVASCDVDEGRKLRVRIAKPGKRGAQRREIERLAVTELRAEQALEDL